MPNKLPNKLPGGGREIARGGASAGIRKKVKTKQRRTIWTT